MNARRSRSSLRVFGGSSHPELCRLVARKVGVRVGDVRLERYSNKEIDVQLLENVRGQDVYIMQTGGRDSPNDDLMELLLLINAFRLAAAAAITVITPFFPYSKGDQKDGFRVPITSKLVADLLRKAGATYVMILDPHTPQLEGFFSTPVDALKVEPLFCEWIKRNVPDWEECVVVSPDEGGTKRSVSVANDLQLDFALIHNRNKAREGRRTKKYSAATEDGSTSSTSLTFREDAESIHRQSRSSSKLSEGRKFSCLSGCVEDRRVIIIDDMIDTGNTLKFAAEVLKHEGASELYFFATHGVFSSDSVSIIRQLKCEGILNAVIVSNSIPQNGNKEQLSDVLTVVDVSGLIAEFIRRHHYKESVSVLSQFMPVRDEQSTLLQSVQELSVQDQIASNDDVDNLNDSDVGRPLPATIQRVRRGFRLSSACWE